MSEAAHEVRAYPGLSGIRQLGVYLLPPGWDARPSQGYPFTMNLLVPIYTPGWRVAKCLPKNTAQYPRPRLKPDPLTPESQVH